MKTVEKKNLEYYHTPHCTSKWKGNIFSWYTFYQYLIVGIICTLAEWALGFQLVAAILNIHTLWAKVSVALGLIVISIAKEIGYTRLIEEEYLRNRRVLVFRLTAIILFSLGTITVILLSYTRYKGWQVAQLEEHVGAAQSLMNEELSFQEQVGGSDAAIGRIKKEGTARTNDLFKAFDPNISSLEELKISMLKDKYIFWMYLFLGLTIACLSAVSFGISQLTYRVLKERVRTEKALDRMENKVADLHFKKEQEIELQKMITEENTLLDQRRELISQRSQALAEIHHKLGQRYSDKWVYEKQDLLNQELQRILKTDTNKN